MSEEIKIALISGLISVLVSVITVKLEIWSIKNKNRRDDFSLLINENSKVINILLDIIREDDIRKVNLFGLKQILSNKESNLLFLYNEDLTILFNKLYTEINKQGIELIRNSQNIKECTQEIINKIREIGGNICDIN